MKDGIYKVKQYMVEVENGKVISGSWSAYDGTIYTGNPKRMINRSRNCPTYFNWTEDKTMTLKAFRGRVARGTATIF